MEVICQLFTKLPKLRKLTLKGVNWTRISEDDLEAFLASLPPTISELDMDITRWNSYAAFLRFITRLPSLVHFKEKICRLSTNNPAEEQAEDLSEFTGSPVVLHSLELENGFMSLIQPLCLPRYRHIVDITRLQKVQSADSNEYHSIVGHLIPLVTETLQELYLTFPSPTPSAEPTIPIQSLISLRQLTVCIPVSDQQGETAFTRLLSSLLKISSVMALRTIDVFMNIVEKNPKRFRPLDWSSYAGIDAVLAGRNLPHLEVMNVHMSAMLYLAESGREYEEEYLGRWSDALKSLLPNSIAMGVLKLHLDVWG